ncbi:hypothetical protein HOL21_04780 [Candidatus Woesearchaeota archaeon]|jgi:hypothetical protein|nr:hypothetical protein [Candidatus Woesearchaeota archaeon]MBT5397501.1 hypothetical protein [Candidatus Woesearchaeota archaeon]MBT5924130.1 hypothetical protein [Candidatus Woesearchaeota archaeon]MBT6367926.1 hypothetical protein [Candidatus Woesearchaeota archaeon]MBT7763150.1 hypothetical protein [Candidatus Woesearchaeota archaeon]
MIQQKTVKKRYKKLPPHSWEPHPLAERGEIRKPYIIAIITVVLLIAISMFLFFTDTFVGKAIQPAEITPLSLPKVGLFLEDNVLYRGDDATIPIKANLVVGDETSAVRFILEHEGLGSDTCDESVTSSLEWSDDFKTVSCQNTIVEFEHATIDYQNLQSGTFEIGNLNVENAGPGWYNLSLTEFNITSFEENPRDLARSVGDTFVIVRDVEKTCTNEIDNDDDSLIDCADPDCFTNDVCVNEDKCDQDKLQTKLNSLKDEHDLSKDKLFQLEIHPRDSKYIDSLLSQTALLKNFLLNVLREEADSFKEIANECNLLQLSEEDYKNLIDEIEGSLGNVELLERRLTNIEHCEDGQDNDNDDLVDCDDSDCATYSFCVESLVPPSPEICNDETDNDNDGNIDCLDTDCTGDAACYEETECTSNDECLAGDVCLGTCLTPCVANACYSESASSVCSGDYLSAPENCADGETCHGAGICSQFESVCDDETDNDLDGTTDCDDSDCSDAVACFQETECTSDDDCGEDTCVAGKCRVSCEENICYGASASRACTNEYLATPQDCADGETCHGAGICSVAPVTETVCDDELDDDGDGNVDCDDSDCAVACFVPESCSDEVPCEDTNNVCVDEICKSPCTEDTCYLDSALQICTGPYLEDPVLCENGCSDGACIASIDPGSEAVCGNDVEETGEACDDGNEDADDGCSATCTLETGWTCTGEPSVCTEDVLCSTNAECVIPEEECVVNLCKIPEECEADTDCTLEGEVCTENVCVPPVDPTVIQEAGDSGSPSTGGSTRRSSSWACSTWEYCDASLEQVRTCTDSRGRRTQRIENRSCEACTQSWVCSAWSTCGAGQQQRTCVDEHSCGVTSLKPTLSKSCSQTVVPGPAPASISQQMQPPYVQPTQPSVQEPVSTVKIWDDYKYYIIGGGAFIILVIIIFIVIHFLKSRGGASNFDELKEWISKERAMGVSDEGIQKVLHDQTTWNDKEIEQAYTELGGTQHSV